MNTKHFIAAVLMACCYATDIQAQATDDFVLGGDMSWITKQESEGKKFRDANSKVMDGMKLFAQLGMQAVRFRVWVNPINKWDGADDVLAKCKRTKELNQKIMIDFHYSDTWADPGHQTKPKAWEGCSVSELVDRVAEHTRSVLTLLKDNGIDVTWVQVGNEITDGMLWPDGQLSKGSSYSKNCARFINAGYDVVKEVFPNAVVILHVDKGNDYQRATWSIGTQKANGAKWDVTGVSFYPEDDWATSEKTLIENITKLYNLYKKPVMICETGIQWNHSEAEAFLTTLRSDVEALPAGRCKGIFYWEPDAYPGYNGYQKGSVGNTGKPTAAITAFYKPNAAAAIQLIDNDDAQPEAFTLDGRKLAANAVLRSGLYIINGEKVWIEK